MKPNRHIFCYGNLCLFLTSFILLIFCSLKIQNLARIDDHIHSAYAQKADSTLPGTLQSVSEKEETETETDYEAGLVLFLLPFFISQIASLLSQPLETRFIIHVIKPSTPVYLLNSVFRI
jgi:hypothetical protein